MSKKLAATCVATGATLVLIFALVQLMSIFRQPQAEAFIPTASDSAAWQRVEIASDSATETTVATTLPTTTTTTVPSTTSSSTTTTTTEPPAPQWEWPETVSPPVHLAGPGLDAAVVTVDVSDLSKSNPGANDIIHAVDEVFSSSPCAVGVSSLDGHNIVSYKDQHGNRYPAMSAFTNLVDDFTDDTRQGDIRLTDSGVRPGDKIGVTLGNGSTCVGYVVEWPEETPVGTPFPAEVDVVTGEVIIEAQAAVIYIDKLEYAAGQAVALVEYVGGLYPGGSMSLVHTSTCADICSPSDGPGYFIRSRGTAEDLAYPSTFGRRFNGIVLVLWDHIEPAE